MSMNLRFGGADARSVVELVREAGVDVLAFQEFTPEAERALLGAGLGETMPYRESHPADAATGSAVYARLPLSDGGARLVSLPGFDQAYATVALTGGRSVIVESVHPVPPSSRQAVPRWALGLRNQVPGGAAGPPRILAGDFNATLDHRELRDLLATGYRDAADAVGAGMVATWPFYGRRSLIMPKIALDHVLVPAGVGVRDFRAVTIPFSDHRAIIASLVIV
jgi:endonuclease/exonuclease/phosphatase (EEP) superfamily protein YafD